MNKWWLLLLAFPVLAADLQREARWANEIVDAILVGEPEWLQSGDHRFLSIYTKPVGEVRHGAVILVHGSGVHPDWPEVINPLRERLPEHGWATLSLQMPVLEAQARSEDYFPLFPEALARIAAGSRFLREQGYGTVVIIGHSLGSQMAAAWFAQARENALQGFVAIGMTGRKRNGYGSTLDDLAVITVPTLDLYGEHDLDSVIASSTARLAAAQRARSDGYTQVEVKGADHMFQGADGALLDTVLQWLGDLK
ncbi:MAG: alpha/beta fold hydrolase [Gammaproteobacteria bacterium]